MAATCTKTIVARTARMVTENTPYGPLTREEERVVTEQHWSNYPGKVSEFISYDVATYMDSRFMGSFITPTFPEWADYSPEVK